MMKRTLLGLFAIAAMTAVSASVAGAQEIHVGPGGVGIGRDHGYYDRSDRDFGDRCRIVTTHRRGPDGSVTVRRRICD
jgi:hypothetical protein